MVRNHRPYSMGVRFSTSIMIWGAPPRKAKKTQEVKPRVKV